MAEDVESPKKHHSPRSHSNTFQRAQETQAERKLPARPVGVITLPPGSRGPRSLYLRRYGDSFGFTLRHFILYPPDSIAQAVDGRHAAAGALHTPMDTIFVKNVAENSAAQQAGLQCGDRIVAVNQRSVIDKSYAQVVQLIQQSPEYLHLLVVPKEDDVLQKFFLETAHNPFSNQLIRQELYNERRKPLSHRPREIFLDAVSWSSLQEPTYSAIDYGHLVPGAFYRHEKRSADNLSQTKDLQRDYYKEPHIDESYQRPRAQPQVPLYRKMGRRASEGNALSDRKVHPFSEFSILNSDMVVSGPKMKSSSKSTDNTASQVSDNMPVANYINSVGCRLSYDGRRESSSSLTSSVADGSKDSLSSYDSSSTLTGYEADDSMIISRLRKSFQKKEEFLRRPSNPVDSQLIQREFYGRPKKLEKPLWPPNEPRQESPSRTNKPLHQNLQRVKSDIDSERDMTIQITNDKSVGVNYPQQKGAKSPKDWPSIGANKIKEGSPAPDGIENVNFINGTALLPENEEDRRNYLANLQVVSKRARQFETGKPLPEDDPMSSDRTGFFRSELARLSSKKVEPNVPSRAREFETMSEPRRDTSGSSTNTGSALRRHHRDSRSLESSGSNASSNSIVETSKKLSGNVTISTGSKYIHVPPPSDKTVTDASEIDNMPERIRTRSNSADSWTAVMFDSKKEDETKGREFRKLQPRDDLDAYYVKTQSLQPESPPLIPVPVERMHLTPSVAITPAPGQKPPAVRPTQLDLSNASKSVKHLPPSYLIDDDSPFRRSVSPVGEDQNKPIVVRRTKNTNIADEDRVVRRESYLKATGNGRMHVDEFSDGETSPQVMRSAHRRWRPPLFPGDIQQLRKLFEDAASSLGGSTSGGSSSSVSLDREKVSLPNSPLEKEKQVLKEGLLHCKVTEIDGKRAADRSWKQVWMVLKGPKLFLFKDRHHQSPVNTSEAIEQSLAAGIDMRSSCVRIAEDYTKRKHVLRVSSMSPCRSELLLQAENPVDLAEWVKALQDQSNETETKADGLFNSKQQPAAQTAATQSHRLSPQPSKSKLPNLRNRSPTGQSPVSKTRKPSQINDGLSSPKSKTWRGRIGKQLRKIQGASSPSSPTAPEGSTFGVPLEHCLPAKNHLYVPRFVEICTEIVEEKGLDVVGIYRVPGNNAAITALTDEVNQNYDDISQADPRWSDIHVVSSLLKSFFRKLPDALLTTSLYSKFIEADKLDNPYARMEELRRLIKCLPTNHYCTLKHLMLHLKRVADNWDVNKMEGRNLAIVFGPTITRANQDDMVAMVNDMSHQYKIVESLINYADWFFCEHDSVNLHLHLPSAPMDVITNDAESVCNKALLLDNISKVEGQKEKREIFSSIIFAAHRKVMRKNKSANASQETKEEATTPNGVKDFPYQSFSSDLKHSTIDDKSVIPTTVMEMEKAKPAEKVPWFNYSNEPEVKRRIQNFIQETEANLSRPRRSQFHSDNLDLRYADGISSSSGNINHNLRMSLTKANASDSHVIMKTNSASNVFVRTSSGETCRNSLNSTKSAFAVQYKKPVNSTDKGVNKNVQYNKNHQNNSNRNEQLENVNSNFVSAYNNSSAENGSSAFYDLRNFLLRRGSSAENISAGNINGNLKKIKYGNGKESDLRRTGSTDSISKYQDNAENGTDLELAIMKIFDEKKKELNQLVIENLPYADESPEKTSKSSHQNKENIPTSPKLYRNPSLHKFGSSKSNILKLEGPIKESGKGSCEKDEDSALSPENLPDNERHLKSKFNSINKNICANTSPGNSKLRRSESLNKPERTASPLSNKLKRSESLNKACDKLRRSDSLTKTEKTESNIIKRRELSVSGRRNKEFTKLKRKNGMPERSIKRRHTVGGTKDLDKVNWLDNRYQEEQKNSKENKEKRTSSPDLSAIRQERLLFEVNLVGPEDMVVALRQHLIGARPQSLPEPQVFAVPLESHV